MEPERTPHERLETFVRLLLVPDWRPTQRQVVWATRLVLVLGVLVAIGYAYGITLWDWMKLLVVPLVIAAGGIWFNQQQQNRQMEVQDKRSQDEALQAYLDQLTQLLVTDKETRLIRLSVDDEVRQVIQARSEPLLRSVDSTRRWSLILFLSVMGLLTKQRPLVSLAGADLVGVDGRGAPLQGSDLSEADLSRADLGRADLSFANLGRANLRLANLSQANLDRTILIEANLSGAYLLEANLSGADLSGAVLRGVTLSGADLRKANLGGADLSGADLSGADLSGAILLEVEGISNEELERQAESLEGALMPNGQNHEDWLKNK